MKKVLITGGAGFIGSNLVSRLIKNGDDVTIFDNLSRAGATRNLRWLKETYGEKSFRLVVGDVREAGAIESAAANMDAIVHLAAQVAVTTSVTNPREDFEINAFGTFNTLEAARKSGRNPIFLYSSTNKVYGEMEEVKVVEDQTRYRYENLPYGASENQPLDFHSPYGCSKGCGDQYVHDYHRIYNMPTVVLRQSCIYGPRQFGIEDQGWVAWFIIATLLKRKMTIYGDGKQVRDILYVDDLVDLYLQVMNEPEKSAGQVFNVGGGADNTISIWLEFKPILEELFQRELNPSQSEWRPGDQKVFISDIRKVQRVMNWTPKTDVKNGIRKLYEWVVGNPGLFEG